MATKYWILMLIMFFILIILFFAGIALGIYIFMNNGATADKEIINFEECAAAGYVVGESYPRQCWTDDGVHFVEEITWKNDQIILMQNSETGEYACFGCGKTMCIDPIPIMEQVEETLERHCNDDFEIVNGKD